MCSSSQTSVNCSTTQLSQLSNDIRESALGFAEVANAGGENDGHGHQGKSETLLGGGRVTARDRPTEAVDYANHGIERLQRSPFFRNDRAAEANRRNLETELHNERNDVAEVAIFHIKCSQPDARAR
jgi:hypothetical protein